MAITQIYTAVPGDVITAARWNNEFGNIYNNLVPLLNSYEAPNLKDDFSAVGDGATSDQSAVASGVAAALAAGRELYWPAGTYLTTASITSFHSVVHRGPGVLKRGSDLFYVDPTYHAGSTNNLYVSSTGDNANDGLSAAEPRLTTQSAGDILYQYPYANITWAINHAAGTYSTTGVTFSKPFPSPNRVQFLGVSVSAGVQPTVIVQATTPTTNTIGWYFQNNIRVQISNINFKNFREAASPSSIALGVGVLVDGRCELYSINLWTDDCDQGLYITNGSQARIQAGRHGFNSINGAGIQFIRHAEGSVGYNGSLADVTGATGTAFIGGTYGVYIQEFSMAHTDFCYFDTQTGAGVISNHSRGHAVSSTFLSCAVGMDMRQNSSLGNTTNTFTTCTQDLALRSGSRHAGVPFAESLNLGPPIRVIDGVGGSTQSATPVSVFTRNFEAKELFQRGTGFKLRVYCDVTGTANTKTIVVTLGGTTLLTATIAAGTLEYNIEVEFFVVTAASSSKYFTRINQTGVLPVYASATTTEDMTAATTLTVTHQVTNVADLNRVLFTELDILH